MKESNTISEWAETLRKCNLEAWLEKNPGKTEQDYQDLISATEKERAVYQAKQEYYTFVNKRDDFIFFVLNLFYWAGFPAIIYCAIYLVAPNINFWNGYLFGLFLLVLINITGRRK